MKKVLIIAYSFPPQQLISSQRPFGLAKYFPQYGWEPVVLTVDREGKTPEGIRIIKAKHSDVYGLIKSRLRRYLCQRSKAKAKFDVMETSKDQIRKNKLYSFLEEIIYFPDPERGWYKTAVKSACEYLDMDKIEAVISTSGPETDHLIAKKIKEKYKIPWIADFRDPWTQNTYRNKLALIDYFEKKMELNTISKADAIVTVTEPWINLLGSFHKGKKIYCISNGYDEDDFFQNNVKLTKKFTITYAGALYQGRRDPSVLFEVINQLLNEKKIDRDILEVRFYGNKEETIIKQVKNKQMEDIVHFYGNLPRVEIINKLMESQILLLLLWNNEKENGFCPGKLYEYFGARRPVLAIGWSGSIVKNRLEETYSGRFADNSEILRSFLLEYYREFIKFGEVKSVNSYIERYSYASLAKKYSEVLNTISSF